MTSPDRPHRMVPPGTAPPSVAEAVVRVSHALDMSGLYFGHGTDNAVDEARWLVSEALGISPLSPELPARVLDADEAARIEALLDERITTRKPLAYLVGRTWFAGIELRVDERALVPRSPLAEFIVHDFFGLFDETAPARVLDLCTGGGSIAIACAHALPEATIDASDLSAEALALAAENVRRYGLEERVRLIEGSLFEPIEDRYELIVSNPPYVDAADFAAMPAEYRHEPALGLAAGPNGLDLVDRILADAARYLMPHGVLVVEVGNSANALMRRWPKLPFAWLEFESGGQGVFALTRSELKTCR